MTAPRLFVIPARDAPVAAILRRGPSEWAHVIRWDMQRDEFEYGAWFKGRIYEDKCDVSPDGRLLLYFCHQGSRLGTDYTDSWTAVSRLPWLHALGLWPWGTTYGGGGRFVGARKLALRARMNLTAHPKHPAEGLDVEFRSTEPHRSSDAVEDADWSGADPQGGLIFCRDGKLYRRCGETDNEIADFNGLSPDPTPAPDWARSLD